MMANANKMKPEKTYCFSDRFPAVGALEDPDIAVVEPEFPELEQAHTGLAIVTEDVENVEKILDLYKGSDISVRGVKGDENHESLIQLLDDVNKPDERLSSLTVYCGGDWCFFGLDKGVNSLKDMQHHIVFWKKIQRRLAEKAEIYIYGFKYENSRQAQLLVNILGATLGASVYVSKRVHSRSGDWTMCSEILS